ncbi:DNA repair protein RadC [Clostridiaceae bacterium M8S5]|nr:DNA repair protein RadC [Clostridiaceae bacterium M8S5]
MNGYVKYAIKDLPVSERPREKLYKYGCNNLSNSELIAIIIRTGSKKKSALDLAQSILALDEVGLAFLNDCSLQELTSIEGVGECKAAQILASIELGKRVISYQNEYKHKVCAPIDIARILMEDMRHLKKEHFKVVLLDTKNQIISMEKISIGDLSSSIVHPREVFKMAIKKSSASIILVHNHPSGDPRPSKEDISITERLIECGKILGINVLDHVIIGNKKYISFKEKGLL